MQRYTFCLALCHQCFDYIKHINVFCNRLLLIKELSQCGFRLVEGCIINYLRRIENDNLSMQ